MKDRYRLAFVVSFFYFSTHSSFFQIINPLQDFLKNKDSYYKQATSINAVLEKRILNPEKAHPDDYSSKVAVLDMSGHITSNGGTSAEENAIRRYEFRDGVVYGDLFASYLKTSGDNLYTIVHGNPDVRDWINSFFEDR